MYLRYLALAFAAATAVAMTGTPAGGTLPSDGSEGVILAANSPRAIPGSYIVVLKDITTMQAVDLTGKYGGAITHVWKDALNGFAITMPANAAKRLAADPAVKYVEQDQTVSLVGTQAPTPSWGLDRVDQRALPLNNSYTFPNNGAGVTAYIIDTGIRITHVDFGGRASVGFDAIGDGQNGIDCHGHGTHVAGTVGGNTYGIAKGVNLVAVRVLNCSGNGTNTQVINGINFVTSNHTTGAAVANMSLGGGFSQAENDAVTNSINDGVTYAIAAGNNNQNACNFSPASTPAAITVGATDINDNRASFSNFGTCLDVFGPGVSITSDWGIGSDTATNTISGTSMATPHVAGVAAIIKAANPSFTPQQIRDKIVADSTPNVVVNPGTGSPNRLLFLDNGGGGGGTTVFSDTFETSLGWTTNPNGTDTATTGMWERGDPEATSSGIALQLGTTVSGTNDLVTARLAGASAGVNDVDSGVTSVRSPSITLPTGTLTLSYAWYLAHLNNASSADFFRVSIVTASGITVLFTQAGSATSRAGAWGSSSSNISSFGGQSVRILFECADASTASLIECGVDNVVVTKA